jgi:predicted nucleotidyltransferase component of viral defense system
MIPENYLREWAAQAPWQSGSMVEQDLVISRSLVMLFSNAALAQRLAFRGGTALHKLHLAPASRYSEDIDLVQTEAGPIGPIFDALRVALDPLLGKPQRKQGPGVVRLTYRVAGASSLSPMLRMKVEINSREHFSVLGPESRPFRVSSRWFEGDCAISTYRLEELLGTKLRALYQRRKGRDLFDLWMGLTVGKVDPSLIVRCFRRYMEASGTMVSGREYRLNMEQKVLHPDFIHDTDDLLRPDVAFDIVGAHAVLDRDVLALL